MSLKDHLRSLGDKEFLEELASSESDLQEEPKEAEDASKIVEELDAKPEPEPEGEFVAEIEDPRADEPPTAKSSAPEPESAFSMSRSEDDATTVLESVLDVVATIEADSRSGRGFLVDGNGHLLTNLSLVDGASRLRISLPSGDVFLGNVVKSERTHDLALVQIPARTPQHVRLGDTSKLDVGEEVFVMGKASGSVGRMVRAVVVGLRTYEGSALVQVQQKVSDTDNGSPFVHPDGSVVGIANGKKGDNFADTGYAVSVKAFGTVLSGR